MTLHFFGLNLSCHLSCHACSCMRSCCSSWQSRTDFTDLYITQSSANSRTMDVVCSARSLMKIRKSSGPSTDPCGEPDFTDAGPDVSPSTTTLWVLLQETTVSIRTGCYRCHSFPTSRGIACGQRCQKLWQNPGQACPLGRCRSPLSQDHGMSVRVGVKYSTCTWYLYLSTYLSVLDVLEYLVYGNVKVLVLVLDQKVLGTYQVIFKYYLLKRVKVANSLITLL